MKVKNLLVLFTATTGAFACFADTKYTCSFEKTPNSIETYFFSSKPLSLSMNGSNGNAVKLENVKLNGTTVVGNFPRDKLFVSLDMSQMKVTLGVPTLIIASGSCKK